MSFRFTNYQAMHGLLENEVTAIVESAPGRFVFGHGTGLSFFDGREFTTRAFAPAGSREGFGATETRIQELCAGRDGTVWMAASSLGLGRISGNGAIRWYREREGVRSVRTVAVDAAGRICLIDDDGLKVMRNDRFVPYPYTAPMTGRRVVADPDGSLWLAHFTEGLIRVAGAEIRRFTSPDNPEADNVYAVQRDSRGILWVGPAPAYASSAATALRNSGRRGFRWIGRCTRFSRTAGAGCGSGRTTASSCGTARGPDLHPAPGLRGPGDQSRRGDHRSRGPGLDRHGPRPIPLRRGVRRRAG